jgi:hypothetical protein
VFEIDDMLAPFNNTCRNASRTYVSGNIKLMILAHAGKIAIGTFTPAKISIGSSKIVNRKSVSLEYRKHAFKNTPHNNAIIIKSKSTIDTPIVFTLMEALLLNTIKSPNISITIELSNTDDSAFPINTASLLAVDK